MKKIFKSGPWSVINIIILIFIVAIVYVSFLPNNYFLTLDDYISLPERAYFSNNHDWLRHLLTFAQSRFTWVGDYMLFRPGLFFVTWFFDIYARHDRALLHALSLGIYAFAGIMLYLACSQYVKRIVALSLCGLFIVPRHTAFLADWPQINLYVFSMIFLTAGALIFMKIADSKNAKFQITLSTLLFFLAALFHEFIIVTLVFSIVLLLLAHRKKTMSEDNNHLALKPCLLASLIVSCSLFLILLIVNWINFRPPSFYSADETMVGYRSPITLHAVLYHYAAFIYHCAFFIFRTVNFVLPDVVIKKSDLYNVIGWFPILVLFAVVAFRKKIFSKFFLRNGKIDVIAVLSFSAVLALLLGVMFGRLFTRGLAMDWYIAMVGYFLLVIMGVGWSRLSDKIPKSASRLSEGIFVVLVIVTILHRSIIYHTGHKEVNRDIQPLINITREISDFFEHNPSYCYTGIFPDPTRNSAFFDRHLDLDIPTISNISRSINVVLYYYSSAVRAGIPVYAEINDTSSALSANTSIDLYQMNYIEKRQNPEWVLLDFSPQKIVPGVDMIKRPPFLNIYEAKNKLALSGKLKSLYLTNKKYCFQVLQILLKSTDDFPVMYNVGIVYRSGTGTTTVALVNNEAIIYTGVGNNMQSITQGTLPRMPRLFSIILRRNGHDCLVFMDEYLTTVIPQYDTNPGRIGILTWENGTPPEIAVDARIIPFKGADTNNFALKPIKRIY